MKLHVLSDLHIEQSSYKPQHPACDVVVLAGDIHKGGMAPFWAQQNYPGKKVVMVAGNHEFYQGRRVDVWRDLIESQKETGVYLLENGQVVIDGVRFLGCTLWTDFLLFGESKKADAIIVGMMWINDFTSIREDLGAFRPSTAIQLFEASVKWLEMKLAEPFDGKTVVVTHHLPSAKSVAEEYKYALTSACFASNLDRLFGEKIDLWIHGHTHASFDYVADGTRVVCNPKGYQTYNRACENTSFDPSLVIEI
jgi:predicted phosphodiesterase